MKTVQRTLRFNTVYRVGFNKWLLLFRNTNSHKRDSHIHFQFKLCDKGLEM